MEDHATIGVILSALGTGLGALLGAVARVRKFEKEILEKVEKMIDSAFEHIDSKLESKADTLTLVKIEQSVASMAKEVIDSNRRMEQHFKTLYENDHSMEATINELRVDVALAKRGKE